MEFNFRDFVSLSFLKISWKAAESGRREILHISAGSHKDD